MASLLNPSSPTSLQLRFRCRGILPPPLSIAVRFRPSDHRIHLISAAGAQPSGDGKRASWGQAAASNSSTGSSGPGSGSGDGESKKRGFGGVLAAGLIGLIFAAGVTFASVSLFRRTRGAKQHQAPVTTEQEASFTPADQSLETDQVANESTAVIPDKESEIDCNLGCETAVQVHPGTVLVPAVVDQVQVQALAALQVLKVIEADVQPGDLCTRREYVRWLVAASSALSRNAASKVYPAMYIENVTELAFDDITPEDSDFPYIQGLAEAGIIASKLSRSDLNGSFREPHEPFLFSPESPLSRQDLISWKMALGKRLLPEVSRNDLYECSGFIDIDKINPDSWPALVADLSAGEQGITVLAFGYTRLFQPNKPVTKAQAAIALSTGDVTDIVAEELTRIEAESLAESAVNAHTALVAEVEKELNAKFEKELANEREKIDAIEKLAEEASLELQRLRAEREEEDNTLFMGQAVIESEMELLSRLKLEVEEQLQKLMNNKMEITFEKDRINKLLKGVDRENHNIVQLQYELEVERNALSMTRAWAEEEAKRAREQARALEEARDRWERRGLKVVVDADLQDDASAGITWLTAGEHTPVFETLDRAENLMTKLREMAAEMRVKSSNVIQKLIQRIGDLIAALKQWAFESSKHVRQSRSKASRSLEELRDNAFQFSSSITDKARRVLEDYKGSIDRISEKLKVNHR